MPFHDSIPYFVSMSILKNSSLAWLCILLFTNANPKPTIQGTWQYSSIVKNQKIVASRWGTNAALHALDTLYISPCLKEFSNSVDVYPGNSGSKLKKQSPCGFWFSYSIPGINKAACGWGKIISVPDDSCRLKKAVQFHYLSTQSATVNSYNPRNNSSHKPPVLATVSIRTFNIAYLSEDSLSIREGQTFFNYRKVQ